MKISVLVTTLLLATMIAFGATAPANYAGNWTLDKKQSKNLPGFYENVQSHKLSITQDEKHLNVAVEVNIGQKEPDKLNFVYNLDGSESKTETMIRTPDGLIHVPTTLKATVNADGRLQITITRTIKMRDQTFDAITVEDWVLSADGKTLSIHRTDDTPRGKMEADMVFVKS